MSEQANKSDPAFLNACEIASQIKERKIGCLEILDHIIKRIETYNPKLNAIVALDLDRACASARAADQAVRDGGPLGPLHGVPITVRSPSTLPGSGRHGASPLTRRTSQVITPWPWTAFCKGRGDHRRQDERSSVVGRLQASNEIYGTTGNPWNLSRSPGGSSGGSAAALAAGLTFLELGSDVAGSICNPAHYCGVFGHKPTYGICPATGHSIGSTLVDDDISVIGPLARSPTDLEIALQAIAGPDEILARAHSFRLPGPRKRTLDKFRLAVVTNDKRAEVDQDIQDKISELGIFLGESMRSSRFRIDLNSIRAILMRFTWRWYALRRPYG